jgi:hypothetical protein
VTLVGAGRAEPELLRETDRKPAVDAHPVVQLPIRRGSPRLDLVQPFHLRSQPRRPTSIVDPRIGRHTTTGLEGLAPDV